MSDQTGNYDILCFPNVAYIDTYQKHFSNSQSNAKEVLTVNLFFDER